MLIEKAKIEKTILKSKLSSNDLNFILETVYHKRSQLDKTNVRNLHPGSEVSWTDGENIIHKGEVIHVGYKNVTVKMPEGAEWTVPAGLVSVAKEQH